MNHDADLDTVEGTDEGAAGDLDGGQNVRPIRPKPRARAEKQAADESEVMPVPISCFGSVPESAEYWGIQRTGMGGAWEVLAYGTPGSGVELREWPLAELSEAEVRRRWGAGLYRVQWLKGNGRGGRAAIGYGRTFKLTAPESASAPLAPAPSPLSSLNEGLSLATQIMGMVEAKADSKVDHVMQMAKFYADIGGGRNNGLGAAELTLILQKQGESTRELITAAVAPLQRELGELRAARDAAPGLAGAAASAAGGLIKGSGGLATALNFAQGNPDLVKAALPLVADMFGKLAGIFTAPPAPRPIVRAVPELASSAAASPAAYSPVAPVPVPVPAPAPPVEASPGSLGAWEARAPSEAPPAT